MPLAAWWERVVASEWLSGLLFFFAGFIFQPLLVCLFAKLTSDAKPKSVPGQSFVYGAMALAGPPFIFVAAILGWLIDRLEHVYRPTSTLVPELCIAPLWVASVAGLPYLYLRRRIKRGQVQGIYCAVCGGDLSAKPDQCPQCGAIRQKPKSSS